MTHPPLRVLVVDDDEDDFILIRDMLCDASEGGYTFEWCATPEQGLNELRRGAHDVYLVDYLLGPASGLDLIEAVNREGLTRAFIVLTGRGNQSVDMAAMEAGASDYLVKGLIDAERLARSIRYAVDHTRFVEVLRESETCHRLLFDEGPVPLMLFDADSLEILTANEAAQAEYADIVPQLVGARFDALLAPHESERFAAQLASGELVDGKLSAWEYRRDGHAYRYVEGIFHAMDYRGARAVLAHIQDVSSRVLADAQLHLLDRAIQCAGNGIVIVAARQPDEPIIFVNRAFERITGYSAEEVIGRNCRFLQGGEDNETERALIRRALATRQESSTLLRNVRKDGTLFWNQLYISPVSDARGTVTHYIGILSDVTAQRDAEARLAYAATHDAETGLARYPVIESMLEEHALHQAERPMTLIYADVDRFHAINETMGHEVGDKVVAALAWRMRELVGERGRVARFTGDEFVIALPMMALDDAMALAEQLRGAAAVPIDIAAGEVRVTMSIGVASYPQRVDNLADLLLRAEASMTRAKHLGRDQVCAYSQEDMLRVEDRRMLGARMRAALLADEFYLDFQPQVCAGSGRMLGFEALLRWRSPELGLVMPDRFIAVAEGMGLMPELGQWVLDRACAQMRRWIDEGLADGLVMAVNVAAQQVQRPDFAERVAQTLQRHQLQPAQLELEVTESSLMENIDRALQCIHKLCALGVRLAFDDFGTGYSSLSYLRQFKVDRLKIDKSFVHDLPDDEDSVAIARTVIAVGHQLQMDVVAEGVETAEQAHLLKALGCDALQGYLIGYPMGAELAGAWLRERPTGVALPSGA
ncbi:MAG: EAL domain-containing protein [Dyella sp.]|uniref:putative bifunctional diguanylate cyclase/phosphodiesterase n=1 Tax=Dyella sp. TaxID=1869338 RepID=UPI003F81E1EC